MKILFLNISIILVFKFQNVTRRYWNMEKKAITIFTAKTARELLKDGFTLIDIKPDKNDPDGKRSIFIFRNDENLSEKIREYKEK